MSRERVKFILIEPNFPQDEDKLGKALDKYSDFLGQNLETTFPCFNILVHIL